MATEGGLRPNRTEFVRETNLGDAVPPANPAFESYSDNIRSFDPTIDTGVEGQEGLGAAFPTDHFVGTVIPELSVEYDLQRAPAANGDASYDGLVRRADNALGASHTIVRRMYQMDLKPENTEEGATGTRKDTRQYLVYFGARVGTVTFDGDPTTAQPVTATLDYTARKVEAHKIDQPAAATSITVAGLEAGTEVTIEDEGAVTTETLTADGTTVATFDNIDAVWLNQSQSQDVTITDSTATELLMTIKGANAYDYDEGDRGVPTLGTGSHAGPIGTAYEIVQGDTFLRRTGEELADEINSTSVTVDNDISTDETTTGPRPFIAANMGTPEVDATLIGEKEYFEKLRDALTTQGGDFQWQFTGFTLQVDNAHAVDVDETESAGEGVMTVDLTLEGEGVTIL